MKQFLALIVCLVALSVSAQDTQIRKGGGGAGGAATNAVATIKKDGTPIVNGSTVIDFTNAAGSVVTVIADGTTARVGIPQVDSVLLNLVGTGAMTNNWNSWQIYGSPTVSNSMFAVNRGLGIITNSTSFSGLLQSIANRRTDGAHVLLMPNPYMSNSYSCDSTVYITNGWLTLEGYGNPGSVIRGTAALNGPAIEVGATTANIGGIVRFKGVRIELDNSGANSVGYKIVDCAEPVWEECEVTGFGRAGIELASTNYMHWGYMKTVWCVSKRAGAKGLLVSDGPLASVRHLNHFEVYDCQFGTFGGGEGIHVNADFPNFRVINSTFKFSSGSIDYGVLHNNGRDAVYSGNKFVGYAGVSPIIFATGVYGGVTNLNPRFYNNSSDGTAPLIELGSFVTNVAMSGNSISGSGPVVLYEDQASNGQINNLDPRELRLGSLSTNALLMTDAYGLVRTTALSGLTLSGGTLTASGSGSPGGTTTTIQYNQGGSFAGSSNFVYDQSSQDITLWAPSTTASISVGYTNNSNGRTNYMDNSGFTVTSVSGTLGAGFSVTAGGVLNGLGLYTNRMVPTYTAHSDLGSASQLFKDIYLSGNAIIGGTLSVTGAVSMLGDGTTPAADTLYGTNNIGYTIKAANSNSVAVTNIVGILHKAYASVVILDCNHGNRFMFTNRAATANTTLVLTNLAQGQEISISMLGESAANDRTVTVVPQLGYLVSDLDAFGVAVALNKSFTLTNNNGVEISALATWEIGTNWCNVVTRQYKR